MAVLYVDLAVKENTIPVQQKWCHRILVLEMLPVDQTNVPVLFQEHFLSNIGAHLSPSFH